MVKPKKRKRKKNKQTMVYNKEKKRECNKRWYKNKGKKTIAKYQKEHKEKISKYKKKWEEENPEKVKKNHKKWRETNPKKVKVSNKKWRGANPNHKKRNFCLDCGIRIQNTSKRCLSCSKLGERSFLWNGGISKEPYDENCAPSFRRAIRKRDNQICQMCRKHREKMNRVLCVHHCNYDKKLSIPQNCISLCINCHALTNFNREHYTKFFQSMLSDMYGYKYEDEDIILEIQTKGDTMFKNKNY